MLKLFSHLLDHISALHFRRIERCRLVSLTAASYTCICMPTIKPQAIVWSCTHSQKVSLQMDSRQPLDRLQPFINLDKTKLHSLTALKTSSQELRDKSNREYMWQPPTVFMQSVTVQMLNKWPLLLTWWAANRQRERERGCRIGDSHCNEQVAYFSRRGQFRCPSRRITFT